LLVYSGYFSHFLSKYDFTCLPDREASIPLLRRAIINQVSSASVENFLSSIENTVTKSIIRESIEQSGRLNKQVIKIRKEDNLLLILNLVGGSVPILGQIITLCSHLYQRFRQKSD